MHFYGRLIKLRVRKKSWWSDVKISLMDIARKKKVHFSTWPMTLRNHFQLAAFINEAFWMWKVKASDLLQRINALQQVSSTVISECFDGNLLPLAIIWWDFRLSAKLCCIFTGNELKIDSKRVLKFDDV